MASPERYNTLCLLGAMDKLWFQRIILSSESNIPSNKSHSSSSSSSNSSFSDSSDNDIADESSLGLNENILEDEDRQKKVTKRTKSLSNSTPIRRRVKTRIRLLERTVSCKTPLELEEEEVKGFIDLGFNFEKDRITPNMISVVPGLQRLGGGQDGELVVVAGEEEGRRKPYLSEAWVIKRPESPLLRLRMPNRASAAKSDDMKNHLKLWAKTVAYSAVGDEL